MTPVSEQLPAAAPSTSIPRYSYYALWVLTLVNFLNYIDRQVLPAVAKSMSTDLGLTDTEIGAMEGALLLSFTVLAPLFGRLGDKKSRTRLMAIAAIIWSLATGTVAFADRIPFLPASVSFHLPIINATIAMSGVAIALCVIRGIVGVGESSYSTITPTLIADYFPPRKRGTALGVFQAAIPMGFALGYVIGAVLAHFFGWRIAFLIVGVPGLITAMLVWSLKEPERGALDHVNGVAEGSHHDVTPDEEVTRRFIPSDSSLITSWKILTTRNWFLATAGYTALTFVLGAFSTWATLLFVREKGMSELNAGIALGVVTLLAGATGTFGGGWFADRFAQKRSNAYFIVCALSCLIGIVPLILSLTWSNPYLYLPSVFITVMLLFTNNAPFHAILVGSVPSSVRASAVALNIVVIHIFGDVISRFGVGVLSESVKSGRGGILSQVVRLFGIDPVQQHLTTALFVAPLALVVAAVFFAFGARIRESQA